MKILKFVILFVVVSLLLAACSPGVAPLMQLPEEGRALVLFIVTAALTFVLLKLGELFNTDLSGFIQPLAVVLSPLIITIIEIYLQMIPPAFDNLVLTVIHFIVLLVGSLGTYLGIRKVKSKQTKTILA